MALRPVVSDPTGEVYGFPTYRWGDAPAHLMTRRQLSAAGKRKNRQDPVAEMRHYVGGWHVAYLYDSRIAAPKRPWTAAKQAAVQKAADAKKVCRTCGDRLDYVPRDHTCELCHDNPTPTREESTMHVRLAIDYPAGTCEMQSRHENGLRDVLRLLKQVEERQHRDVVLTDRDGQMHGINLAKIDRISFDWEPSADQDAPDGRGGGRGA